ncbi:MAG: zinc ABC transporter substrate-binding protein [Anaerolineae bacterium]|jgi:ABC-type Zn uptake system ZnuABC Zn-binding protein ZnuA|nr:zinc ABC transporter substrate-binding protein [Anaerolineae bacterium]
MALRRLTALCLFLVFAWSGSIVVAQPEPLRVVATYSILGDIVQNIAGDQIELTVLVGPDGDSHVYEPTPQDAIVLSEADLIFENGLEFETWLDDLYEASGSTATRIVVSEGIEPLAFEEHEEHEEHEHEGDHDHMEAPTTLEAWQGEFMSASSFGVDALQPGWEAVIATTPELTTEDLNTYWQMTNVTSFDTFSVNGDRVTFGHSDGDLTCTYAFVETHPIPQVEGETWSIFDTTEATCLDAGYQYLLLNPIHAAEEGSIPHFHMSYGSGDLETLIEENGVFFPSLYPVGTTAADIILVYEANARPLGIYVAGVVGREIAITDEEMAMMSEEEDHDHDHEHGEFDPHIWHDPNNGIVMTENIRDALIELDPTNAAEYETNAEAYIAELTALDEYIRSQVTLIPEANRILVTSHDTFGYFAEEYGFEVLNVLGSISTEAADPGAGEIAELAVEIEESGIPAIFAENITNPDLIEQVADEAGVQVAPALYTDALGQLGTPGESYISMLRYNIDTITEALR